MWESYTALKAVIEQKDEVINQLYSQLSDLQDRMNQNQSIQQTLFSSSYFPTSNKHTANKHSIRELQVIADREFYAADKVSNQRNFF